MPQQVPMPLPVGPFNVSEGNAVAVSNFVDAIIGDPSLESYGGFVLLSAPIVLSVQLDSIVAFTFSCLNKPCAHIIHVLQYNKKIGRRCNTHHQNTFHSVVVYNLFVLLRVQNSKLLVLWAVILTAVDYSLSTSESLLHVPLFFGQACSQCTLDCRIAPYWEPIAFDQQVMVSLNTQKIKVKLNDNAGCVTTQCMRVMIGIFDYTQASQRYKYQHDGATLDFVIMTSWMFLAI